MEGLVFRHGNMGTNGVPGSSLSCFSLSKGAEIGALGIGIPSLAPLYSYSLSYRSWGWTGDVPIA